MKHNPAIIALMAVLFLCAQVVGLAVTSAYLPRGDVPAKDLPLNLERPEVGNKDYSFFPIMIFILVATGLILLLIKFRLHKLWKAWFFLGIFFTLTISLASFLPEIPAVLFALGLAALKFFYKNPLVANTTELFIYGALAALFVPLLSIISAIALLLLISVYDYIAVRRTEHMITLAKFQTEEKLFAGLSVPYKYEKPSQKRAVKLAPMPHAKGEIHTAILGGGDIGFPLIFAGTVMNEMGLALLSPLTFVIPIFSTIALVLLFILGSDKKFYPAMPYLTVACLIGYGIVRLVAGFI
ncbi:hypothetical protein HY501_00665 [Candidatus Woesearchaeota archaeon]|nr:hypothetical protein [Candidatus Woesearchaeota archaeon]